MRTELLIQMERYFQGGDSREHFYNIEKNELFAVATLLDPRYKSPGFIEQENVANARKFLMIALNTISVDTPTSQQDSQDCSTVETAGSSSKRSGWDSVLDSSSEDENDNSINDDLEAQVNAYFNEKRIGRFDDPLYHWKARAVQWPQLTQVAGKYLCAPIRSCASEREFKVAKNVSSECQR